MSETCEKCGAGGRRDTYQVGDVRLQRWLCGTQEHVNGSLMIGAECYERQLTALRAKLAYKELLHEIELEAWIENYADLYCRLLRLTTEEYQAERHCMCVQHGEAMKRAERIAALHSPASEEVTHDAE